MALSTLTFTKASRRVAGRRSGVEDALDEATIAELSAKHISRMTQTELARVVQATRTPASHRRLEYLDRPTLERLAHQARLCAEKRIQSMHPQTESSNIETQNRKEAP